MRLAQLRTKHLQGQELSIDEMREVVGILAAGRVSASASSDSARRKTASGVVRSAEDMLKGIGG
jgi:hypothetical protein